MAKRKAQDEDSMEVGKSGRPKPADSGDRRRWDDEDNTTFQEFPKVMYSEDGLTKTVESQDEQDKLGDGWSEKSDDVRRGKRTQQEKDQHDVALTPAEQQALVVKNAALQAKLEESPSGFTEDDAPAKKKAK